MLLQLQSSFSLHQNQPPSVSSSSVIKNNRATGSSLLIIDDGSVVKRRRTRTRTSFAVCAAEKKDSEFELDRDRAREALKQLDQQLQTLSQKPTTPPKRRAIPNSPDLNMESARNLMKEEPPEFSGSYLAFSAVSLLIISMFYNILFLTVIKPSIDGPESEPFSFFTTTTSTTTTSNNTREAESAVVLQQSSPSPISSSQE